MEDIWKLEIEKLLICYKREKAKQKKKIGARIKRVLDK